jgi:3-oxocholest-4-en-26-oate---CoA ligase
MTDRQFNLADLFELVADAVPDRDALVAGNDRRTFKELDERATRFANYLLSLGLEPGAKVAIYSWNRVEWVEAFLGAFKARMIPINVNYRYVADELRYVLDNADVEAIVFERSFAPLLGEVGSELPKIRHRLVLEDGTDADAGDASSYEVALAAASAERPGLDRSPDDHYFLYTGGTTGMPKGVMWRQEDVFFAAMGGAGFFGQEPVSRPEELVGRIQPEDATLSALALAPIMHGAAQWGMCMTLFSGGKVVLFQNRGFDAHLAWSIAERERVKTVMVVGDAMARPLADALADKTYELPDLVTVGSGGAVFSKAVKDQLSEHLPHIIIVDTIGASEMGASGTQIGTEVAGPRFMVNEWMTVLGDDLRPVEPGSGEVGRIARRGYIPLGYYKDEAKTAATYLTDPDGVRWSVPGDFGVIEKDGSITLLGRGSGCVNTGGEKVYPEEVEAALKSHPAVFDALVVGVPDERFGERVAAVVAPRPGTEPTLDELAEHCRESIAGYKVPRELRLVDQIGRTPSGKADYAWAKSQF